MTERQNEGYAIIVTVPISNNPGNNEEIVIGMNRTGEYVVWNCKSRNNYFWGRYVTSYKEALNAMMDKLSLAMKW